MTKRLYYHGPYMDECDAVVTDCIAIDGGYEVSVDQTVIFPEGGGQPSDTGFIDKFRVISARDAGGDIWLYTDGEFKAGQHITMRLNLERRFDHSQQHTGEHIVSGIAKKLFDVANIGFHMAEDYVTIDFDSLLTDEQLLQLEEEANRAVYRNIRVISSVVTCDELDAIPLRKRAEGLQGDIRLVSIAGIDSCTCCGTHTLNTGEVGIIKITDQVKYKSGIRIWLKCGKRALQDYRDKQHVINGLARAYSTKWQNVNEAVLKQMDELSASKHVIKRLAYQHAVYRADELLNGAETAGGITLAVSYEGEVIKDDLGMLAEQLCRHDKTIAVLFGLMNGMIHYRLMRSAGVEMSMKDLCQTVNVLFSGKGGGRPESAQGSSSHTQAFEQSVEQLKAYMKSILKK